MKRLLTIALLLYQTSLPCFVSAADSYTHLWSGFSSSLANRSPEQRKNATLAGRQLDGVIIPPNGVLSFNERVGGRDIAKGYASAPNLNSSGLLEEAPGGGICQLASTIYNAGLLGGLEIVERHPHSRAVFHVPPGRDATISTWRKDLKLRNPFPYPLMLRISSTGERLTASFRSTVEKGFQVELSSRQIPLEPEAVAVRGAHTAQPGNKGFSTQTWRRITRGNGVETSELVSEDFYPPPSRIIAGGGK